jgi:hypothetical protein
MFATVPYELVMRRGPEAGPGEEASRHLDGLGRAMQVGLHDELEELCAALGPGEQDARLDALADFADQGLPEAERAAAARLVGGPAGAHLEATLALATGADGAAHALRAAIEDRAGTHAEVRARVALASLGGDAAEHADLPRAIELAPHLEREIRSYAGEPSTLRAVLASQLGLSAEASSNTAPRTRLQHLGRWLDGRRSR